MAILLVAGPVVDTPHYKEFFMTTSEADAINTATAAFTFAAGTMGNFTEAPTVYWAVEVTSSGDTPTGPCNLSIYGTSTTGFTANNTSQAAAAAVHTWRVYMTDIKFNAI
jgi:hypothetical protein